MNGFHLLTLKLNYKAPFIMYIISKKHHKPTLCGYYINQNKYAIHCYWSSMANSTTSHIVPNSLAFTWSKYNEIGV